MNNPLQLAFYKGMGGGNGALQLNMQKPHYYLKSNPKLRNYDGRWATPEMLKAEPGANRESLDSKEGCLFMEICSTKGKNDYDWANKVVMALSITDMSKLLVALEGGAPEVKIMHDPGAGTSTRSQVQKWLNVSSPNGVKEGVFFRVSQKRQDSEEVLKHSVPLDGAEVKLLACCLRGALPACLGWTT